MDREVVNTGAKVLALLLAAALMPGCVIAIGNKGGTPDKERIERLEKRIVEAEGKLGIESPAPEEQP